MASTRIKHVQCIAERHVANYSMYSNPDVRAQKSALESLSRHFKVRLV